MPLPTYYTEVSLSEFAHACVEGVADVLGWTVEAGSYQEVLHEVLLVLGGRDLVSYVSSGELAFLRAVTRREAWRGVLAELVSKYRFGADFQSYDRQQMYAMAEKELARASAAAAAAADAIGVAPGGSSYAVRLQPVVHVDDPYVVRVPGY
jgi:hypothetical protein